MSIVPIVKLLPNPAPERKKILREDPLLKKKKSVSWNLAISSKKKYVYFFFYYFGIRKDFGTWAPEQAFSLTRILLMSLQGNLGASKD